MGNILTAGMGKVLDIHTLALTGRFSRVERPRILSKVAAALGRALFGYIIYARVKIGWLPTESNPEPGLLDDPLPRFRLRNPFNILCLGLAFWLSYLLSV